ncbi:MAG TPA: hypothetical protein VGJ15_00035 [Pirellulales bacterium]|jgi:hypothetical protein
MLNAACLTLACLALVCSASGCALQRWPYYFGPDVRKAAPTPDPIEISYRLDAARLNIPVAVTRVEGQLVSYDDVAGSLQPNRTVGSLHVVYPHPQAQSGFARVELRIDADPTPSIVQLQDRTSESLPWFRRLSQPAKPTDDAEHEIWQLDVPRSQLDSLLGTLAQPGHVATVKRGQTAGAALTTQVNGHQYQANCQPLPELDALMRRVRNEGQLVEYRRPMSAQAKAARETSAVVAYQNLRAKELGGAIDPYGPHGTGQLALTSGVSAPTVEISNQVALLPPAADSPRR